MKQLIARETQPPREGPYSQDRRRFTGNLMRLPLLAFFGSALTWTGLTARSAVAAPAMGEVQRQSLQRILYLLFPFPEVGEGVYQRSLAALEASVSGSPEQAALVGEGLNALAEGGPVAWLETGEEDQVASLEAIESTPFFFFMLRHAQATIFNDPEVWDLIGYGGSSLEFGGYGDVLTDGIDWIRG
jgi:hypothetical protein